MAKKMVRFKTSSGKLIKFAVRVARAADKVAYEGLRDFNMTMTAPIGDVRRLSRKQMIRKYEAGKYAPFKDYYAEEQARLARRAMLARRRRRGR